MPVTKNVKYSYIYLSGIESGGLYIVKSSGTPSRGTSIAEALSARLEQNTSSFHFLDFQISSYMVINKTFAGCDIYIGPIQIKIPH